MFLIFSCSQSQENKRSIPEKSSFETRKIIALWDSLTAGYGLEIQESYPAKLQKKLQEGNYNYEVINAWISWDTSDGLVARAELYLEQNPEIVMIVIGWNDGLRGLPTTNLEANILKIVDMYSEAWVKVVLGGMDVPANLGLTYRRDFRAVYNNVAQQRKNVEFLEFFLEWVAGKSQYNLSDMIHPNSEWYDIIVENLYKFLEKNKVITK